MSSRILVVNAGSSSVKFEVIDSGSWLRVVRALVERLGNDAKINVHREGAEKCQTSAPIPDVAAAIEYMLREVLGHNHELSAIGHRVVHGGEKFHEAVLITDEVIQAIKDCTELAPLHNPPSLNGIEAARAVFASDIPQVAVFDTAFHQSLPEYAYLYAIPYALYERHKVRRYGFHGTSYRYLCVRYQALTGKSERDTRVVALHLGNGCSICAIEGGKSIETSMGLSPLEGLMMGTRSGDIDPTVVGFLMHKENQTVEQIERTLNTDSGLLGISGSSSDMRDLMKKAEAGDARAKLAIDMFCHRARKYVGAYLATMGGADALIFSAGIGENNAEIRQRICRGLECFGLEVDGERNRAAVGREALISTETSKLKAYVIPTDEELMIAQDTARLMSQSAKNV